ncbi:MAG: ABC transporter permease [Parvularculaceae bacterium]
MPATANVDAQHCCQTGFEKDRLREAVRLWAFRLRFTAGWFWSVTKSNGTQRRIASVMTAPLPVYDFDASRSRFAYAWRDLTLAIAKPHIIVTIIANDIANRYKGAALGAFWITLTTLATVSGLALLYGKIFGADIKTYFPYVTTGIITWGLMSTIINDGANAFVAGASLFTQSSIPKAVLVFRIIGRALWILMFKLIVLVAVFVFVGVAPSITSILKSLVGLSLLIWTGFFCSLALGPLSTRFRDFRQFVDTGLTFSFFATPVFWHADRLGEYAYLLHYNPFYHFLNIVRGPLINASDVNISFVWAFGMAAVATVVGWVVYGNFARRLPYWC